MTVPAMQRATFTASHDDFGLQWPAGVSFLEPFWDGYRRTAQIPDGPVDLVLRRGVVLRGRAVDDAGRPFSGATLLLIPAYVGSGPARIEAQTDEIGHFAFPRAVLGHFELVPRDLEQWRPRRSGEHRRIVQARDPWLAAAMANSSIEVRVERYVLDAASADVTALNATSVQVWLRWGANTYSARALTPDASGRVQILMERGIDHELWLLPGGTNLVSPWSRGAPPIWRGIPTGSFTLTIPAPNTR